MGRQCGVHVASLEALELGGRSPWGPRLPLGINRTGATIPKAVLRGLGNPRELRGEISGERTPSAGSPGSLRPAGGEETGAWLSLSRLWAALARASAGSTAWGSSQSLGPGPSQALCTGHAQPRPC